jgi:methylated-DNA-protein-cysteine methyltransferase related protein
MYLALPVDVVLTADGRATDACRPWSARAGTTAAGSPPMPTWLRAVSLWAMPYRAEAHGPQRLVGPGFHRRVHDLVAQVPPGWVTTYGDLAAALGSVRIARQVGFALAALPPASALPWWRVVAAGGRLSTAPAVARRQAVQLRAEGIQVRAGRVVGFGVRRFGHPLAN